MINDYFVFAVPESIVFLLLALQLCGVLRIKNILKYIPVIIVFAAISLIIRDMENSWKTGINILLLCVMLYIPCFVESGLYVRSLFSTVFSVLILMSIQVVTFVIANLLGYSDIEKTYEETYFIRLLFSYVFEFIPVLVLTFVLRKKGLNLKTNK
jgi:hypothetical protein